jgi:hypothetical protein
MIIIREKESGNKGGGQVDISAHVGWGGAKER